MDKNTFEDDFADILEHLDLSGSDSDSGNTGNNSEQGKDSAKSSNMTDILNSEDLFELSHLVDSEGSEEENQDLFDSGDEGGNQDLFDSDDEGDNQDLFDGDDQNLLDVDVDDDDGYDDLDLFEDDDEYDDPDLFAADDDTSPVYDDSEPSDAAVEREVENALSTVFGKPFSWKRELLSWVMMFVCAFLIAFVIDHFIIVNATVPTGSMQNTIMAGDRMIGWQFAYLFSEPERGDVIIFDYPDDPSQKYVKRIIGLPGETVTITDGLIYIDDASEPLEEDYLPEEWVWENDGYVFNVPSGSYLVLGDNRNNSHDARFWTNPYVTKDAILGKALFCYWPLNSIKKIN